MGKLLWFAHGAFLVCLLQDVIGLFLLSLIGNKSLAVEFILNTRKGTIGRAKIHEYPRAHASQLGNAIQHSDLMAVDICLILFGPSLVIAAVQASFGIAAKLAYDERLVVADIPLRNIGSLRMRLIPADIFVDADDVEDFA